MMNCQILKTTLSKRRRGGKALGVPVIYSAKWRNNYAHILHLGFVQDWEKSPEGIMWSINPQILRVPWH